MSKDILFCSFWQVPVKAVVNEKRCAEISWRVFFLTRDPRSQAINASDWSDINGAFFFFFFFWLHEAKLLGFLWTCRMPLLLEAKSWRRGQSDEIKQWNLTMKILRSNQCIEVNMIFILNFRHLLSLLCVALQHWALRSHRAVWINLLGDHYRRTLLLPLWEGALTEDGKVKVILMSIWI